MTDTPQATIVYTRDDSSGKIHKRYRTGSGELASLEGDNLDDAGAYTIVDVATIEFTDPGDLCERCFGA